MCCSGGGNFPSADEIGQAGARYNRIDQWTPWGSTTYHGPERNIAVQRLSPGMRQLEESLMGLRMGAMSSLMDRFGANRFAMPNPSASDWRRGGGGGGGGGLASFFGGGGGGGGDQDLMARHKDDPRYSVGDTVGTGGFEHPWATQPFEDFWNPEDWNREYGNLYSAGDERQQARQAARREARNEWRAAMDKPGIDPLPYPAATGTGQGGGREQLSYLDVPLDWDLGMDDISLEGQRGRLEQAMFDRQMQLLDPYLAEQQGALDETMNMRRLPTGTEEAEILQGRLARERMDTRSRAALDAILGASGEVRADRGMMLNEALSQLGAQQGVRGQLFGEDQQMFNELASLLGLAQVGGQAGLGYGPGQVDMNAAYGTQMQGQMYQDSFGRDLLSGLLGLGGSLGSAYIGKP